MRLLEIVERNRGRIDEAYHEFADHSAVPLLQESRQPGRLANVFEGDGPGGLTRWLSAGCAASDNREIAKSVVAL